jgi:subfamily B ATP-binding cassette protein MsbA
MYIFDEPNAALDLISEKIILDSIHELIPDSVVIMIMHRVSNIVFEAKNIVVLKDGQIHEIGTHEELIRNKGLYFELYQIQNGS